jgi:hypothetical protein
MDFEMTRGGFDQKGKIKSAETGRSDILLHAVKCGSLRFSPDESTAKPAKSYKIMIKKR